MAVAVLVAVVIVVSLLQAIILSKEPLKFKKGDLLSTPQSESPITEVDDFIAIIKHLNH